MSLAESTINGYHPPLRLDRSAQGGGVAVWIKENLAYEQLRTIDCGDHEIIWLTVNLQGRKKLVLGGLYRPGSAPGHDISILEHLDTSLDHVRSFGTNVMLAGDFNVHNGPWLGSSKTTRAGEYLEEICAVHGLVQHVKTATRGNNPLDLILSDLGDRVSVDVTSPIGRSDHSVLLTKIATCPQREKRTTRRVWRYSKADWGRLGKFYRDVEWSNIISSDPNLACKGVTETILDGMHRHIPNKRLTTRPSDPSWWTPECTAAVQAKRRSWDRLHTYPSKENEDLYKTHCARCVACLHNAKERGLAAVRQRLKSGSLQDKQWWSTLKAAGGDGRQCTIPVIRDDKGNEHTTSMDKASCFGRHFSAKCSLKEDLHQSDLPHFPRRCDTVLSQVRFRPTTVRRYLKGLDVSKATGPDGIPARVLKQCAAELSQPLSQLFSLCFQHGTQPSLWKTANVVPIHKKRSRTAVQNYRPVSLLSVLSKVMEKVVNRRIMTYLEKENLLSKHQFGFRTGLGTADLLTSLNHQWLSCINTGGAVRVLAVDIAGAFDRVSHVGVLHKIRSYGLDGTLHRWLTSYLTDRNLQVVVGGATSQPFPIAAGVPQGSILGPVTLFLLYVNDAADVLPDGVSPATYADDTTLYSTMSSMETATATCQTFQTGVNKLAQWGATWRIQFEPSKSQAMTISRHRVDWPIPPVAFNGLNVADVDTIKLLGVTFDRHLHYGQHLRTTALRAARRIGFLRKACKVLDHKGRTAAYKGFVRPMLEYCPLVWSGAADGHLRRLDKVQKRALSLLGQGTIVDSLVLRRTVSGLCFLYKLLSGPRLPTLNALLPPQLAHIENPRTRRQLATAHPFQLSLPLPVRSNDSILRAFPYGTVTAWNALPLYVLETAPTPAQLQTFKVQVHRHLLKANWLWATDTV